MFSFLRNCQTVFQNGCIISHSHQQCLRTYCSPPHQHSLQMFQIMAIVLGVWCYLVLICIFLMFYDVKHLFICLFASVYFLWWDSVRSFAHFFLTQLISYCSVLRVFCIFLYNPLSNIFCKYFIQAYGLFFHSVAIIFHRAEVLNFVFLCYKHLQIPLWRLL